MVAGERYVGGDGIDELLLQFDGDADLSTLTLSGIERMTQNSGNELSLTTRQLGSLTFLSATEVTITNRGAVTLQPGAAFFVFDINLSDLGNTLDLTGANFGSTVNGGAAADRMIAGLGPVVFRGNGGNDTLTGGAQNDVLDGGAGNDRMIGGFGDDDFYVDSANDIVTEAAGGGIDAVLSTVSYTLAAAAEVEILAAATYLSTTPLRLTGNGFSNTIIGNIGNNVVEGGGGSDILVGGAGRDTLTGGAADDYFYFADGDLNATRASADTITDFNRAAGDLIVLEDIDARETAAGDQAFTFIGSSAFSGLAGQLRYDKQGGNTYIEGDTDGNRVADFVICLTGTINLVVGDFVL
jgi:Ca2+-binding RTX toxin-like protein